MKKQISNLALALTATLALTSGSVWAQQAEPISTNALPTAVEASKVQKSEQSVESSYPLMTVSDETLNTKNPASQSPRPRGESRTVEVKSSPDKPLLEIKGF